MSKLGYLVIFLFAACLVAGASASTDSITYTDSAGNTIGFAYAVTEDGELAVAVAATSDGTVSTTEDDTDGATVATTVDATDASTVAVTASGDSDGDSAATVTVVEDGTVSTTQTATADSDGATASQDTTASGDTVVAVTTASDTDGDSATTVTVVEDGTVTTEQTATSDDTTESTSASQITTASGETVIAETTATAEDGSTASTDVVGTDASLSIDQSASADDSSAAAAQTISGTAEILGATTESESSSGASASSTFHADDVIYTGTSGISQAAGADDSSASASQVMAGVNAENIVAVTSADDGNGNSVSVGAVAEDASYFGVDQSASAGTGADGSQTVLIAGTGFVGAFSDADSADGTSADAIAYAVSDSISVVYAIQEVSAGVVSTAEQSGVVVTSGTGYSGTSASNGMDSTMALATVTDGEITFDQASGALPVGFPSVGGAGSVQTTEVTGESGVIYTSATNGFGTTAYTVAGVVDGGSVAAAQIAGANMEGAVAGQIAEVSGSGFATTGSVATDGSYAYTLAEADDTAGTGSIYAAQGAAASNDDVIAGQIAYVDTPTGSGTIVTSAVNGGYPYNYATVTAYEEGSDLFGIQVAATGLIEDNDAVAAQAVIVGVPVVFGGEGAVDNGYVYTEAGNGLTGAGAAETDITTTVEDQKVGAISVAYAGSSVIAGEFEINDQNFPGQTGTVSTVAHSYTALTGDHYAYSTGDTATLAFAVAAPFGYNGALVATIL